MSTQIATVAPAAKTSVGRRGRGPRLLSASIILLLILLIVVPILAVLVLGQRSAVTIPGQSALTPYTDALTGWPFYQAWLRTLAMAAVGTALAVVGATVLSWVVTRTNIPGGRAMQGLIVLPLLSPVLVTAFGWATLGAPDQGFLNRFLGVFGISVNLYSTVGMGLVLGITLLPIAFLVIRGAMATSGAATEEAAVVAGATLWQVTRNVTLPAVRPSISAAAIMIFAISVGNFAVPAVLGIPAHLDVTATKIYFAASFFPPNYSTATLYGGSLILVLLVLVILQQRMERRAHIAGQSTPDRSVMTWKLGWTRWLGPVAVLGYVTVAFVLPMLSIVTLTFLPFLGAPFSSATLDNYDKLFTQSDFTQSLRLTITLAVVGATAATLVGSALAYLIGRLHLPGATLLNGLASTPLGVPGIILGLGYLYISVRTPWYGSFFIVVVAVTARFLPYALRNITAAQLAIHESQEEAARVCGANEMTIIRHVTFPLLRQPIISTWALLFIFFVHEVDTNVLLQGSGTPLSVLVFNAWGAGDAPGAATASMILVLIGLVAIVPLLRMGAMRSSRTGTSRRKDR